MLCFRFTIAVIIVIIINATINTILLYSTFYPGCINIVNVWHASGDGRRVGCFQVCVASAGLLVERS